MPFELPTKYNGNENMFVMPPIGQNKVTVHFQRPIFIFIPNTPHFQFEFHSYVRLNFATTFALNVVLIK
jgi:hypothetical protein